MAAQRRGEFCGALVGEEQARAVDLDDVGGAGDGVAQPVGPLAAEEDVTGAPDDEGRDVQARQGGFNRQQVAGVQGCEQALELAVAGLRAACLAWIRLACDQVVRQIMLIDAPAVLGWQRWRELDEQGSLGVIRAAVAYAAEAGSIERGHVDTFAHIVLAAVNEVALLTARAADPDGALGDGERAFAEFLDRLLGDRAATA
jgi:hypothetical protein